MSHEFETHDPPELRAVEQALAGLVPAPPRLDRDRLMFLAGAASALASGRREPASGGREPPETTDANVTLKSRNATAGVPYSENLRHRLLWPVTSAALAATLLVLATVLLTRPAPVERIVYLDRDVFAAGTQPQAHPETPQRPLPTAFSVAAPIPADNYVRSREVALRLGLDALGNRSSSGSGDASPAPTYRSLIQSLSPAQPSAEGAASESSQM